MENFVFGCDVNLVTGKLISVASKKLSKSCATELAHDVVGSAYITFNRTQNDVSFEKFIWVVYKNKLNDELRKKYVRKNMQSLDTIDDMGNKQDPRSDYQDIVQDIKNHAKELFDANTINLIEYNIIVMKAMGFENQDIAREVSLSNGRISQIWSELQIHFWSDNQD